MGPFMSPVPRIAYLMTQSSPFIYFRIAKLLSSASLSQVRLPRCFRTRSPRTDRPALLLAQFVVQHSEVSVTVVKS